MAAAPATHQRFTPVAADPSGAVAAGGPTAEMQRMIEARFGAIAPETPATSPQRDVAHALSRVTGPALLVIAYAAIAAWWF